MTRRALMLLPSPLDAQPTGPQIRALELAAAMQRAEFDVTVAAHGATVAEHGGMGVIGRRRRALLRHLAHTDLLVATHVPAYLLPEARRRKVRIVADLYHPMELEHAAATTARARTFRDMVLQSLRLQLRYASVVLCASADQEKRLRGIARDIGADPEKIVVVPFGIAPEPSPSTRRPLRERFPEIGSDDPVVLWWGGVWRWFDATTAIDAFAELERRGSAARLVVAAGQAPDSDMHALSRLKEVKARAADAGVTGQRVFFVEDWIPFAQRHEYLQEATVGLTLHNNSPEAPYAARSRYMDYLWCGAPSLLNPGDSTAAEFEAGGFGRCVPVGDALAVADAIEEMVEPATNTAMRRAGRELAARYAWHTTTGPLLDRARASAGTPVPGLGPLVLDLLRYGRRWAARRIVQRWTTAPNAGSAP